MAWRRGFLRLWLVASILFAAVIGFTAYQDYQVERRAHALFEAVPVRCANVKGVEGTDYGREAVNASLGVYDEPIGVVPDPSMCWVSVEDYRRLYLGGATTPDDKTIIASTHEEIGIERQAGASPWPYVGYSALAGLGIPVLVLVAGAILGWIVSGFRRSTT